ncbi:MAG TPA: pyridoxal phosphate-dependent aminotransferase [Verrucomicrobiae bacterium]|nr:pyridoxal phosphate-dependent aminotransferase [Verrucomicrobiae bacterium]
MKFPEIAYMSWAKAAPGARSNLARSGLPPCPIRLLRFPSRALETPHAAGYGWPPLRQALGRRYRVAADRVLTVSGGTSLANWVACAAALDGAGDGAEVIVERPTYEPLLRIPEAMGAEVRRLDRWFAEGWAIDPDRLASLVTPRTRLAIVTNLHNPSGARISMETLRECARILARAGAYLLVDEVYLECLFGARTESSVHAWTNVITTNSLTKAYGLDGLRAGWILGPREIIRKAGLIHDLLGVNGVAPGEAMTLAALRRLPAIRRRARSVLGPNLEAMRRFFEREARLEAHLPPGGNVLFARLPEGIDSDRFARRLLRRYDTLVVPGRFFESPRFVRLSFGCAPPALAHGLRSLSRTLDDLGAKRMMAAR